MKSSSTSCTIAESSGIRKRGKPIINSLETNRVIEQFPLRRAVLYYISIYSGTVLGMGGNLPLTLSSIMTRSLGSVRSIFRTLCLVCA